MSSASRRNTFPIKFPKTKSFLSDGRSDGSKDSIRCLPKIPAVASTTFDEENEEDLRDDYIDELVEEEAESDFIENPIYSKGYPFYVLTSRENRPRMNLYENFSVKSYCESMKATLNEIEVKMLKKSWPPTSIHFGLTLLKDAYEFSKSSNFSVIQGLSVLEIFYSCYERLQLIPLMHLEELFEYFRNTLYLYGVFDPPDSMNIFFPIDLFSIAKRFSEIFEVNFELFRLLTVPKYEFMLKLHEN